MQHVNDLVALTLLAISYVSNYVTNYVFVLFIHEQIFKSGVSSARE